MKTTRLRLMLLALGLLLPVLEVQAQPTPNPPGQISYQGYLTDANGLPLATNSPVNYNVIFRIYNASTAGTLLWAEQQVVTVDRGYFTVLLGNGTGIGGPNTNNLTRIFSGSDASDRYLELTVEGLAPGDPPIAPRLRLLTSPYSFLASTALNVDGSALTSGTVTDARLSSNVALRAGGNTFSGNQNFTAGDLVMDNSHAIWAKNTAGNPEIFFWPRYADNVTYLNYGSGGLNIRNDADATTMFMDDNNDVGITGNLGVNGTLGIGAAPTGLPLSFANSIGDKLSLFTSSGGNYYGFGVQSYQLQIHSDTSAADIVFGYGQSGNFGETMRIRGNGKVGIGASAPGKMLQIGDPGNVGSEGMIRLSSRSSTGGGAQRTWDIGVPQTGDNTSGTGYSFVINDGSTTDFMVQYDSGNVGIGTVNPSNKLQIGNPYDGSATGYALMASSPNYGANIQINSTAGIGLQLEDLSNGGANTLMISVVNSQPTLTYTYEVRANGNCYATAFNQWSDRNAKENFQPISPQEVLTKVSSLPIQEWNFKTDTETRHVGPMAQDFYAAFGLGTDDKHIATMDADGIALAAIQGLNQKLEQRDAEIAELKSRLDRLEGLLSRKTNLQER